MKKTFYLIPVLMLVFSIYSFGQGSGKAILPFNEGKVLSEDDISFLRLVNGEAGQPNSRGGTSSGVSIGKTMLASGSTLSKSDAEAITKTIASHIKSNEKMVTKEAKAPEASRGASGGYCGYCCYYYWWDYSCGCYLYEWYYCCACY